MEGQMETSEEIAARKAARKEAHEQKTHKDRHEKQQRKQARIAAEIRKQEDARARKVSEKQSRMQANAKLESEQRARKAQKTAERQRLHQIKVAKEETSVIEKKQREVTIDFLDFPKIKEALADKLSAFGEVESIKSTLTGCEVRFNNPDSAKTAIAAGEIVTDVPLGIQAAEIKQHAFHFFLHTDVDLDVNLLAIAKDFFEDKAEACNGEVSLVGKKRGSVIVYFNNQDTRDRVLEMATGNWAIHHNIIGTVTPGQPPRQPRKRKTPSE